MKRSKYWGTLNKIVRKRVIRHTESIHKKVYDYLREQSLSGDVFLNERLIETKIAGEIGSSRTPVREALHILENEGC